jgi:2-polyprenyl-6-hydroxyphenyl methylase/3-demethylubiquinone-9 3-methyltransferase
MPGYYSEKLSAERLKRVYEIATPRVQRYLDSEIDYVVSRINPGDRVIELGCGYGRVMKRLSGLAGVVIGIDSSSASVENAREYLAGHANCDLSVMDAAALGFQDRVFDVVVCIQNGISAFAVHTLDLVSESLRVVRSGGRVLFSSYSERFWEDRLEWFELQAREGLLGEIDHSATGGGIIVCKDGFRATTFSAADFREVVFKFGLDCTIEEVDESSLFCEIVT